MTTQGAPAHGMPCNSHLPGVGDAAASAGPREMVQEWDGAEPGTVLAEPCPAAQAGAGGQCWRMGSPGLLHCGRGWDRDRVWGPSASPALAPRCWAGRREGREGSSKGTLVSDEGSPLAVRLVLLTVRL